ncbi:hypothetical protein [Kinneretia aquatilis]|uniref:hypothetical protein n=1 Tax=Kinneretia aquatilis TaxID=2070761 RepID=UPI001057183B|nr:hypothetical protein [Paucibacter aquatile]
MREFPPINRQAEDAALQTLFFRDSEFEGRSCRLSISNYLAFLSMRGSEIQDEVNKLRNALTQPDPAHLERDIVSLLHARNWRFHNIACVAIACTGASESLLAELWSCIAAGSWTSPQLAATAAYVDPEFRQKATRLIEDHRTYYKSIVSLGALLSELAPELPSSEAARACLDLAATIDRDESGSIATSWRKNLAEAFSAA